MKCRPILLADRLVRIRTVESNVKISDGLGGFTPHQLDVGDAFGSSVACIGDLDRDGVSDLAVGAPNDEESESG